MKYLMVFTCVLSIMGCTSTSEWKVNTVELEREVSNTLQLYPSQTDYSILIVPDREAVSKEHNRIFGRPTKVPAFYAAVENLIVIPMECEIRILRHEIGHAVVRAYFNEPIPSWLHEELARKAESPAPES